MQVDSQIWMTILGFISLSIVISIVTHFWIRYHLKIKPLICRRNLIRRVLIQHLSRIRKITHKHGVKFLDNTF